jgi:hAT family C-terminal dimerisation region
LHRQYPIDLGLELPLALPTVVPKPTSLESRLLERIQGSSKQESDIDRYFEDGVINVSDVSKDNWWFEWQNAHQGEYSQMLRAAREFLPLPALGVICARLFSTGREMLGLRRYRLDGETMRLLMLLKNEFDAE